MLKRPWLTKSILGIGLRSLFSDMGHGMTTAILPMFPAAVGGTAATLGLIEGIADAPLSVLIHPEIALDYSIQLGYINEIR